MSWVYIVGGHRGDYVKFGISDRGRLGDRLGELAGDDPDGVAPLMLAGVRTDGHPGHAERLLKMHPWPKKKVRLKTEYRQPVPDLIEYVNWLRTCWWVSLDGSESCEELELVSPDFWSPDDVTRRLPLMDEIPEALLQPWQDRQDHLRDSPWERLTWENEPIQDYFTPLNIMEAARRAMGGIDLDAASHPLANRKLRIPVFFMPGQRDAMKERWFGRVWLNPPYPDKGGTSKPWLDRAVGFIHSGDIEQFCMLSPIWIFHAQQARELMSLATMLVLLSPTPVFWGNKHGKTGTNHPHAILYVGHRTEAFQEAFEPFGLLLEPKAVIGQLTSGKS